MVNNEYEVALLAQEGNEDAINLIYQKYTPIIAKKSQNAIVSSVYQGIEINDIMQEGYMALDEAIKSFSQDSKASFYTFATLCIDRRITSFLKRATGYKDKILNEAMVIDDAIEKTVSDSNDIELNIVGKQYNTDLITQVSKKLTDLEKKVLDLKIKGYKFEEIIEILHKDKKSIYNAIQRIKFKIREIRQFDE